MVEAVVRVDEHPDDTIIAAVPSRKHVNRTRAMIRNHPCEYL
jgi:hypothetical protein